MSLDIEEYDLHHLADHFSTARPILFTGAGFSLDAKNITGNNCPNYGEIKKELWRMCIGTDVLSDEVQIHDLYDIALQRHRQQLKDYLISSLTIDCESLPEWYGKLLSFPWHRCYTLNIDDIETATNRKYTLLRAPNSISATSEMIPEEGLVANADELLFVHLNGTIEDIPEHSTFSLIQYAERLNQKEPWYVTLSTELMSEPFVFIGTKLNEPPLWQHIEFRRKKGGRGMQELRPRSYLVTPELDQARKAILSQFNIVHIPLTAKDFCEQIQSSIGDSLSKGKEFIRDRLQRTSKPTMRLPLVEEIAKDLTSKTDYLIGAQPVWADIHMGRAISRETDDEIWEKARQILDARDIKGIIAITGTAGSGKSTSLMRLALKLNSLGKRVAWVNSETEISPRELRIQMKETNAPEILIIDDADMYGRELIPTLREISSDTKHPFVAVGIRSNRIDRFINKIQLKNIPYSEHSMPPLTDSDISGLLEVLGRENRLGRLRGMPTQKQEDIFREQAGRILIVAMIQATSGKPFEEKLLEEYDELPEISQRVYSLLIIATHFRFSLSAADLLVAIGQNDNESLNSLELLTRRHLLISLNDESKTYRVLHRLIADMLFDKMAHSSQMYSNILSLGILCAVRISPKMPHHAKPRRLLRLIINHDFLLRVIGVEQARNIYGDLENYQTLTEDNHFWLQRGALEVEEGSLHLAENFLNQSRSLDDKNSLLENEYAYLLFKKANQLPGAASAPDMVEEAIKTLESNIVKYGNADPYPYHIAGSQGLSWARRGISDTNRKKEFLENLCKLLDEGCANHPNNAQLDSICKDVRREYLLIATK